MLTMGNDLLDWNCNSIHSGSSTVNLLQQLIQIFCTRRMVQNRLPFYIFDIEMSWGERQNVAIDNWRQVSAVQCCAGISNTDSEAELVQIR